jgi:hypothetical protein
LPRIDYTLPGLSTQFFLGNSRDQVSRAQFQYELGLTHRFADDSRLTSSSTNSASPTVSRTTAG